MRFDLITVLYGLAWLCGLACTTSVFAADTPVAHSIPRPATHIADAAAAVPAGWRQEEIARGDLNGDGRTDLALLLRATDAQRIRTRPDGQRVNDNPRLLVVYLADTGGGFRLATHDDRLIPTKIAKDYDPINGIAAGGIAIERGLLRVSLGYFADEIGTITFTFRWQNHQFALTGYDRTTTSRVTNTLTEDSYNYLTARHEHRVERPSDSTPTITWQDIPKRRAEALPEIGNGFDFDPLAPPPIPKSTWNWADGTQIARSDDPWMHVTQAICAKLRPMRPPRRDVPGSDRGTPDGRCDTAALYYGIGEPADPSKARACAFYEIGRPDLGDDPFHGIGMLMTIYANGRGAERNLDLATALACRVPGAPYELESRIRHLQAMKSPASGERTPTTCADSGGGIYVCSGTAAEALANLSTSTPQGPSSEPSSSKASREKPETKPQPFDYCDDITSGYAAAQCAARDADIADAARNQQIESLVRDFTPRERAAFTSLRRAAEHYAMTSSDNEVDLSGTARGAFAIEQREAVLDAFVNTLVRFKAGQLPPAGAEEARAADRELNALYRKIMAIRLKPGDVSGYQSADSLPWTTVTHEGIRTTERAWLAYRDAWLQFIEASPSTTVRTATSQAALLNDLTRARIAAIKSFAETD